MPKIKVKCARAEVNVPLLTGGFISGDAVVEVEDVHYYQRAIHDGDLLLVAAVADATDAEKTTEQTVKGKTK